MWSTEGGVAQSLQATGSTRGCCLRARSLRIALSPWKKADHHDQPPQADETLQRFKRDVFKIRMNVYGAREG